MAMSDGISTKKLPKAERRAQLLVTARAIIAENCTDALTLAHLAERAGVSKPIAYEHFGTRAGLLMALCSEYNDRQMEAQAQALAAGGETLADVAAIFSAAYINCVLDMGTEVSAAFAALAATDEMAEFRQTLRDGYITAYCQAFGRVVQLPPDNAAAIFMGFLGAAEALAEDAASGRTARQEAIGALTRIFTATLSVYPARH